MRKVLSLLVVAMFAFGMMACNQANKENEEDQAILDSIAKVEAAAAEQAVADSIQAAKDAMMAEADTIMAEVEEVIEEVAH